MSVNLPEIGLGCRDYQLAVYIANRPALKAFEELNQLRPLLAGELANVVSATGNHWRKIFNLYAKLAHQLSPQQFDSWQDYRDQQLLKAQSREALLFSQPDLSRSDCVHIVSGKGYGEILCQGLPLLAVDPDFQICESRRLIVSPYFDYRQLSNLKLERLCQLVTGLMDHSQLKTSASSR